MQPPLCFTLLRVRSGPKFLATLLAQHDVLHPHGLAADERLMKRCNGQRKLDELMRQLVKVAPRVESAILLAPQLATLAAWGWLFRLLAALRTRGDPRAAQGPNRGLRCQREVGPKPPIPRPSTSRLRMYWATRRSRNASRRVRPPYTVASRLRTRCMCERGGQAGRFS